MKKFNLVKTLTDLGLTENEANVYLAMLKLGQATILQIARKTNIKRPTVYTIIESLRAKGLVAVQAYGFKKRYIAEDPDRLKEILHYKKEKLLESLPILSAMKKFTGEEGVSKYYEGLPAIKSLYDSVLHRLEESDDYLVIGNPDFWYDLDPVYFQSFADRRVQVAKSKNARIMLLLQESDLAKKLKETENYPVEVIKMLPKNISIKASLAITPRQLIIHQTKGQDVAVVIENPSIIETMREIFNVLWEMS